MSTRLQSAIVLYKPVNKMVKQTNKPARRNATPKKRKAGPADIAVVHEEESPTSVVDNVDVARGVEKDNSIGMIPRKLPTEGVNTEKDQPLLKGGEGSGKKQCFVVEIGDKKHMFGTLEAAFAFKETHGSETDSISVYDSFEKAEEAMLQKSPGKNDDALEDTKSTSAGSAGGGMYDFGAIDESALNLEAVADFRRQRDAGKFLAVFAATSVIGLGNKKSVIVPFCIFEDDDKVFWAFKASKVKEALEYLCTRVPTFSSLGSVVESMRPFQIRDVPFGANVGRVNVGKKGSFAVESLAFIVEGEGKVVHPHEEVKAIAHGLKQVFASKMFRKVYIEMLRGGKTLNMAKSIEEENNHVWTIFCNLSVDVKLDVPLNMLMLDWDIKYILSQAGVRGGSSQWSEKTRNIAFREGVVPGNF